MGDLDSYRSNRVISFFMCYCRNAEWIVKWVQTILEEKQIADSAAEDSNKDGNDDGKKTSKKQLLSI